MKNDKKQLDQTFELSEKENKEKSKYKNFDFLTEVLACMAWTTKA
jgi:hypothetical protein